jgi:hypothetical protein
MFATARLTKFAGTALVAGSLGLGAVATAGTAGAVSSTDDSFQNAHYVCSALDDGADPVDLGVEILDNSDLTTHQAAVFVVTAVNAYCPEYTGYFE